MTANIDATACPKVLVAALTYNRPDLLAKLLSELAVMERPSDTEVTVLIVDNDAEGAAGRPVFEEYSARFDDLRYVLETRKGIPVARNRALDEALSAGADALCFIDDDEYPRRDWLVRLVTCWKRAPADLVGGPFEVAPAVEGVSAWGRFVNYSLAARALQRNRMTANAASRKRRYTIVTNNWLCDLEWQRRTGLRFDERLLMTGGSDTEFFRQAQSRGCRTAWCPEALVYAVTEPARLKLSYQFWRAASQSMNHFHMKNPRIGAPEAIRVVAVAAIRLVLGGLLFVVPVLGGASPVVAMRSMGWAVGRVRALFGHSSHLYG
jgi:succinoglycan biosynthesis protein ExoM